MAKVEAAPSQEKSSKNRPVEKDDKTFQKMHTAILISATTWDIFSPPPSNSFSGKVVPRMVNRFKNRRKLSLEVHQVTSAAHTVVDGKKGSPESLSYEECVLRILVPEARKGHKDKKKHVEKAGPASSDAVDDEEAVPAGLVDDVGGKVFDGWEAKYRIPCQSCTVKHQVKKSVFMLVEVGKAHQEREVIFDSLEDAQEFCEVLEKERKLEDTRAEARQKAVLGDLKLPPHETITLLMEIVSGWELPIGDFSTSDPYVICSLGRNEVHRTKPIFSTIDPVWTLKTGSLFLLTVESKTLFLLEGLACMVKDYDRVGANESLGVIRIPALALYKANGERMVYKLQPPPGSRASEVPGYLAIRCRRATDHDKEFMKGHEASLKAVAATEHPPTVTSNIRSIVTRHEKVEKDGTKKYKIRPRPDPKRTKETEWMTNDHIQKECLKETDHWVDMGAGNLGKIYVEILGCDGLPNLDTGGFLGNKTDAFVSLVFEDCYVRTDVIDDCLAPRWLPWTRRGFVFQFHHSSSQLLLGVFDFDAGIGDHDLIGRVSVDISNLVRDTTYVLSYNIYPSARVYGRECEGKITLRLRLEIPDERMLLLSTIEPPPDFYVNVKTRKDFRVVRSTCIGKFDYEKYSINIIKSYIEELTEYNYVLFYLEDAIVTLLLWRGHFPMRIGARDVNLPIHSFNAFIVATVLVERPQLFPAFCFASIAWILIAVMGWRRNSPNAWWRCKSYGELMEALVLGDMRISPPSIKPFERFDETKLEMEQWVKRIEDSQERSRLAYIEAEKAEQERLKELEEIGDTENDMSTKVGTGFSIDPTKVFLHPIQLLVGWIVPKIRFVKNVVIWEECYISFWVATASAFLAIVSIFIPWFWIIKWSSRLVAWTIFGPWMKLLDIFYFSTLKPETEIEKKLREQQEKLKRRLATTELASQARQKREDAAKLKVMKKYMFGKFGIKVPVLKEDRWSDRPLPESSATPYSAKSLSLAQLAMQEAGYNRTRIPGQNLIGNMIPTVQSQLFTAAPIGKATAHPNLLDKSAPGRGNRGSDSTGVAYAKIGSAVVLAGVVTWFFVPLLAAFTEKVFEILGALLSSPSPSDPEVVTYVENETLQQL